MSIIAKHEGITTVQEAIKASSERNEIVHFEFLEDEKLLDDIRIEADDEAETVTSEGSRMVETWGCADGEEWRVHFTFSLAYRVYRATEGESLQFCGERGTIEEARALAKSEPVGLDECMYETARASGAGHCDGYYPPDESATEVGEPQEWIGEYCIVLARY